MIQNKRCSVSERTNGSPPLVSNEPLYIPVCILFRLSQEVSIPKPSRLPRTGFRPSANQRRESSRRLYKRQTSPTWTPHWDALFNQTHGKRSRLGWRQQMQKVMSLSHVKNSDLISYRKYPEMQLLLFKWSSIPLFINLFIALLCLSSVAWEPDLLRI